MPVPPLGGILVTLSKFRRRGDKTRDSVALPPRFSELEDKADILSVSNYFNLKSIVHYSYPIPTLPTFFLLFTLFCP